MSEQELFTDLARAEKNAKKNANKRKIRFSLAVRDAFIRNDVDSFFDLVMNDVRTALNLRELAIQENLL